MPKSLRWTEKLVNQAKTRARVRLHEIAELDRSELQAQAKLFLGISESSIPNSTLRRYLIDNALDIAFTLTPEPPI